jgi:hypothetical protein
MSPRKTVFKRLSLSTLETPIGKRLELQVPIWHSSTCKAFLIHLGCALKAINRKGYSKAYKLANESYVECCSRIKQSKAQLVELDNSTNGEAGTSKKSTKKSNVTTAEASPADQALQAELVSEIKQAREATDNAKAKGEGATEDTFQLYVNLLSVNAKYAWNKTVHKQIASDPYTNLQGCPMKGPKGLLRKSFDDCMMFHFLTVFSNNAAEQEWYYITKVLKKPQRVSICQIVQ